MQIKRDIVFFLEKVFLECLQLCRINPQIVVEEEEPQLKIFIFRIENQKYFHHIC